MKYALITPEDLSQDLASRAKDLRLSRKWKRSTLAARSGVSQASLRRFEETGQVSMKHFLKIIFALGRLDEMASLLKPAKPRSIADLEQLEQKQPKRGSV